MLLSGDMRTSVLAFLVSVRTSADYVSVLQDAATLDRFNLTTSCTKFLGFASIKFNGTAVYFMSYGISPPYPDSYEVTVDGKTETGNLRVPNDGQRAQFIAYWRTGLDPSMEHQVTISNPFLISLNIDAFV